MGPKKASGQTAQKFGQTPFGLGRAAAWISCLRPPVSLPQAAISVPQDNGFGASDTTVAPPSPDPIFGPPPDQISAGYAAKLADRKWMLNLDQNG